MNSPARDLKDKAYHDEIAETYDRTIVAPRKVTNDTVYRGIARHVFPRLHSSPSLGEAMLDLGCGTGHLTLRFGAAFKKVIAVDHSEGMLNHARSNATKAGIAHAEFICSDGSCFIEGCADNSFSLVGCVGFLHHLELASIRKILEETYRVLSPGGYAIFQEPIKLRDPHVPNPISKWNASSVVTKMTYTQSLPHPDEEPIDLDTFLSWTEQTGFKSDWINHNWEIFPQKLPPTLKDRLAIRLLNIIYGRSGNVCTLLLRK